MSNERQKAPPAFYTDAGGAFVKAIF